MKAIFVETGLELRILTNHFVQNYFHDGIIISVKKNNKIDSFAKSKNIPLLNINPVQVKESRWVFYTQQIQKIRLHKVINSKKAVNLPDKYFYLSLLPLFVLNFLFYIFSYLCRYTQVQCEWKELEKGLLEREVQEVVLAGYSGPLKRVVSKIAAKNGIEIYVIQNSWKDLFINPYLQIYINKMNVWSKELARLYKRLNSNANNIEWIISWHPRFFELLSFAYPCAISNSGRIIILYTCANPKIITDEMEIVEQVIKNTYLDVEFIIRPNPQDFNPARWRLLEAKFDNCTVENHDWLWDARTDMNFPLPGAEEKWARLLSRSLIVMGIASTVMIEALLLKKRVINVVFGADGKKSEAIKDLTCMPYYEGLLKHPAVFTCLNASTMNEIIEKAVAIEVGDWPLEPYLLKDNTNA